MKQTTLHGEQSMQFTCEDVARVAASVVHRVLEALKIRQMVEGIAVFPTCEGVMLIDIVMGDLPADNTWSISIMIPPTREQADKRE